MNCKSEAQKGKVVQLRGNTKKPGGETIWGEGEKVLLRSRTS